MLVTVFARSPAGWNETRARSAANSTVAQRLVGIGPRSGSSGQIGGARRPGVRSWPETYLCARRSKRLKRREIPEQIAGRLKTEFPDEPEMWVSADTIYQSLYVQARGGLRELTAYLRTGRYMRKPRRRDGKRHSRIPGMVLISERPPEVEDRAVPGHWEGDLILGWTASKSAVGT
jgi:IS30 family transposase